MTLDVAIVGAGIMGRLIGVHMIEAGFKVTLFSDHPLRAKRGCSYAAAGMLAPYCELESTEHLISLLGRRSIDLWPHILTKLPQTVSFSQRGSLVVAPRSSQSEMEQFAMQLKHKDPEVAMLPLSRDELRRLTRGLEETCESGLLIKGEGQIDNRALLDSLATYLEGSPATLREGERIVIVRPYELQSHRRAYHFDLVVDCRGMGARENHLDLRGVRGELIWVHAPEVTLDRPVRVLHPRYPIYVVPRDGGRFIIGATAIESENRNAVSIKSTLELLLAAYHLHPGFRFASVLDLVTEVRPAYRNNLPKIIRQPGLVSVNGLYRHGYLLAPVLAETVMALVQNKEVNPHLCSLIECPTREHHHA